MYSYSLFNLYDFPVSWNGHMLGVVNTDCQGVFQSGDTNYTPPLVCVCVCVCVCVSSLCAIPLPTLNTVCLFIFALLVSVESTEISLP